MTVTLYLMSTVYLIRILRLLNVIVIVKFEKSNINQNLFVSVNLKNCS